MRESIVGLMLSSSASSDRPIGPLRTTVNRIEVCEGVRPAPAEVPLRRRESRPITARSRSLRSCWRGPAGARFAAEDVALVVIVPLPSWSLPNYLLASKHYSGPAPRPARGRAAARPWCPRKVVHRRAPPGAPRSPTVFGAWAAG